MEPESFFLTLLLVFSADSLARLLTRICSAARSASCLFSMNQTCSCSRKKAVIASWVKRELTDFFVWFSKQPMVEKQLVTSTRLSWMSWKRIFPSVLVYLLLSRRYLSKAAVKPERTALSGLPPYSSQEEL